MKSMSQTFDLTRFGYCLRRDLSLNGRGWLLRLLLMIAVTTLLVYFTTKPIAFDVDFMDMPDYEDFQLAGSFTMFRFCGFIFCMLGASLFMENMTTPGNRLNSLMSPSSNLEKYLSRVVICVIGVTIAFVASFALAEFFRLIIIKAFYGDVAGLRYVGPFEVQSQAEHWYYLWGFMIATQATYVLGSTIAPKNSFLKTSGVLILLGIVLIIVVTNAYNLTRQPDCFWPTETAQELILNTFKYAPICWAVFCYITAYYRMKESEIIERL